MKNSIIKICITVCFIQSSFAQNNNYQLEFKNSNYKKVIALTKTQLKNNPKDSIANFYLGFSYANLNNHKKAIQSLEAVKNSGLVGPKILLQLAQSYLNINKPAKALQQLAMLDKMQFSYYQQLDKPIYNTLKNNKQFIAIRENMYKRANPCKYNAHYKKFDFWVGEWNVYARGRKIAESSITHSNGNCGIIENWRPLLSNGGSSISYYDTGDKKWKQVWVANGSVSYYVEPSSYKMGNLQLIAKTSKNWLRMVWYYNKKDDTVRQTQESSTNMGKTWTMGFDGLYKRKQ